MDESTEILKIEIPDEEETPAATPDNGRTTTIKERATQAGKGAAQAVTGAAAQAAQKGWDSDARKTVTGAVKKGATAVAAKSADLLHEHLVKAAEEQARQQKTNLETRLRETDWKAEGGKAATASLRWASRQVGQLARRLSPSSPTPDQQDNER